MAFPIIQEKVWHAKRGIPTSRAIEFLWRRVWKNWRRQFFHTLLHKHSIALEVHFHEFVSCSSAFVRRAFCKTASHCVSCTGNSGGPSSWVVARAIQAISASNLVLI